MYYLQFKLAVRQRTYSRKPHRAFFLSVTVPKRNITYMPGVKGKGASFSQHPHVRLFGFVQEVVAFFKSNCPYAITEQLFRVDVFQNSNGDLVVNEFESLDADFHVSGKSSRDWESEVHDYIRSFWTSQSSTTSSSQSMAERAKLTLAASNEIDLSDSSVPLQIIRSTSVLDCAEMDLITATSHDVSRSKRITAITCDGECHCSLCQWAEENSGEKFLLNAGKKCQCGRAYLAMQCYNANRRCFNCSITIV